MKSLAVLTTLIIVYFVYGFFVAQLQINVSPTALRAEIPRGWNAYRGAINVRTSLSNGSSPASEVIAAAKKANLDFLIFTDVNQFDRSADPSGYYGNLLVMNMAEYSYLDSRLILLSENPSTFPTDVDSTRLGITDLLSQKIARKEADLREPVAILAHPFSGTSPTWSGAFPPGLNGIEVLNPRSIATRAWGASKLNVIASLATYPFNPNLAFLRLFEEPHAELMAWDRTALDQKFLGFSGADASARALPLSDYLIHFPTYQKSLEITSNHILVEGELVGSYARDRSKVLSALRRGQFYFALDLLGDSRGFWAELREGNRFYPMGVRQAFRKGQNLYARIPWRPTDNHELVILRNGVREVTSNQTELIYEIPGPGVYRVIFRVSPFVGLLQGQKWFTWAYSNHFTLE